MILDDSTNPNESEAFWRAFYVKPRHEKKASDRLQEAGFTIFCPLIKTKVKWHDRWKKVQKPWINGYIFACVTENERRDLLLDPSVVSTVCNRANGTSTPALIRDEEIYAMKIMTREATEVTVFQGREVKRNLVGEKARVKHGPFKDAEGIIEKLSNNKISLKLNSLNIQLLITVEPQDVEVSNE